MRHEDNGLGAIVDGILDCWNGTGDTLVVGDVLIRVEGDVEINLADKELVMFALNLDAVL